MASKVSTTFLLAIEEKRELSSDAHPSEDKIQESYTAHQPINIWYGVARRDEPDSPSFSSTATLPTGRGTIVAVLDSGINVEHNTFKDAKIFCCSKSFVNSSSEDYSDTLGHGTQCAGLLCGSPDNIQLDNSNKTVQFQGIAVAAQVMVCKVVKDGTDIADIGAVCRAIDHILEHNRNSSDDCIINVISLSFGMEAFDHNLTKKIQEAVSENIIIVCAASNNGKRTRQPITYPARLGHVLCIGSCGVNGKPSDFTPVGRELDFLAQGENVWAPTVGGANAYAAVNGTSFAAPLVAGIVCQIIEDLRGLSARVGEPMLLPLMHNVWCVRELLKEMATVQGKHSEKSGFGKLDPREYFEKGDEEKIRIVKKILMQS